MRKIAILILIIQTTVSSAQLEHFPSYKDQPIWGYCSSGGFLENPKLDFRTLYGDTIINGITYSKLYLLKDTILNKNNLARFIGGVRSNLDKVYMYDDGAEKERLLYDFSVSKGDTVDFCENNPWDFGFDRLVVEKTVTKDINGNSHKLIELYDIDSWVAYSVWIENIGGDFGLEKPYSYLTDNNPPSVSLVYFKMSNERYYIDENCNCFKQTSSITKAKSTSALVYPNPLTLNSVVKMSSNEEFSEIEIYDLFGKTIVSSKGIFSEYKLNNNLLRSGIYVLKIKLRNKENYITKILVKNH